MGKAVGNLFGIFGLKTSQFQKKLKNLERSIKKSTKNFKKIGDSINKNFTLPLAAVSAASFKMSKDFNESMSNVATLIPDNIKRINNLKGSIQDLSIQSGESTSELSEGLYNVVSALGDSSESMDTLGLATKSAKAGVGSIDDAIGLLSATTKGYGDTTFAAQKKVADFAQMTIKLGQTTLADLGISIQQVTSLSNELGVSQEELFSSFSSTTGVLGNASIVATQYKATLKALINPKEDLIKLYKKLGIESGKQLIAQEGLQGALKLIAKHATETKLPLQKLVGSAEAVAFTLSLTGAQSKKFKSDLDAMKKSTGALTEAYRQKTQGIAKLGFQYDQMVQTLAVTSQIMGDALAPAIERINEHLKPMIAGVKIVAEKFKNLDEETKKTIFDLTLLVSGAGLTFTALGALGSVSAVVVSGLSSIAASAVALNASIGFSQVAVFSLKNSLIGLAAFAAGWKFGEYLNNNFEEVKLYAVSLMNGMEKVWETLKFGAKSAGKAISFTLGSALTYVSELTLKTSIEIARGLMKFGGEDLAAPIRKWALDFRKTVDENQAKLKQSYDEQITDYKEYKEKLKAIDNDTVNVFDEVTFGNTNKPEENENNDLTDIDSLMKKVADQADDLKKKIAAATNPKEVKAGNNALGDTSNALEDAKKKAIDLGKKTSSTFMGLKKSTSDWNDQMADTFTDLALRGDLTAKNIAKSMKNMFLSSMVKTGMSSLMGMFKIPGFSKGGRPKGLSMVGENGPELVDFENTGAYIKSANETRSIMNESGGSGASVIVQMSNVFNDNVSAAVKQELLKATPILKGKIIDGVVDALERREISL